MRVVIQRTEACNVSVDEKITGSIEKGLLLLVGIESSDTNEDATWLSKKIVEMRIFSDQAGKMNHNVIEAQGGILVVSQFTLHAQTKKGNRPSFIRAARPDKAVPIYNFFIGELERQLNKGVQTGVFGATMKVSLVNDGPVTILMDSKIKE